MAAVARLARHPIEFPKTSLLLRLWPFNSTNQAGTRVVLHARYPGRGCRPLLHAPSGRVLPGFIDAEVHGTVRAYQTEAEIFPGIGHDMMLDTDWRKVADRIGAWIRDTKQQKRQIHAA
jgi:hypothetical protein